MATHEVWAYSEKPAFLAELIGGARVLAENLGGSIVAVVIGPRTEAEKAISLGASKVFLLDKNKESTMVEDYVPTLANLVNEQGPSVLLFGATKRGKAIAGRLAARIGTSVITDAQDFIYDQGQLSVRHMIFGGGAVRIEKALTQTLVATIRAGVFDTPIIDESIMGEIIEAHYVEPAWRMSCLEHREKKLTTSNLAAAKRVVCPGRGISKREDLALINDLAQVLEAEVGCTRPLAEGLDWMPRDHYIGVSGASIAPDLYLGIGVSGQVQHTVGIVGARIIAAINKDKNAPIIAQADYGIIGDLYEIVPSLIKFLKARK